MADSPAPGTPQSPTKAVIATVVALIGSFLAAVAGKDDIANMGMWEWLAVIGTTLAAGGLTYAVPNTATRRRGRGR